MTDVGRGATDDGVTNEDPLAQYWRQAAADEFAVPECRSCGHRFLPPRRWCPACGAAALGWRPARGATGSLYSFTVIERPPSPDVDDVPYVLGLAELDLLSAGSRLYARVVDVQPEQMRAGMPIRVETRTVRERVLPAICPKESAR